MLNDQRNYGLNEITLKHIFVYIIYKDPAYIGTNYDKIKSHITDTMNECVEIIDMIQTQLASIDDEDFKNYLINIKMIDAPKK